MNVFLKYVTSINIIRLNKIDNFTAYLLKAPEKWKPSLEHIRDILLEHPLEETIKWGGPVYTHNGKNIVGLGAFKNYVALWFFQGALLTDKYSVLHNAQQGKTKALRQWRFMNEDEIDEKIINEYIAEAIANQRSGREIKPARTKPLTIPVLLADEIKTSPGLGAAFEKFSLSKQKEFVEYLTEAKRESTKQKRLQKIIPMILEGVGLNDKYRR